jgi:hypothetical protein
MTYKNEQIIRNMLILDDYAELVDAQVLEPYKKQIRQLPLAEQKSEWYKYNTIDKFVTQAIDTVVMLNEHNATLHSHQEVAFLKRQIEALSKYVKILGGNPSIISYTKELDI